MQIVLKKVDDIRPYPNNPRKNDNAVDAVAASIAEFGFKQPIVIDSDGVVIAGHTRLKAAKKLGLKEVPCITADDLTPEQVKAYRLADNKVAELATWDFETLDSELLDIEDIDMSAFGFIDKGITEADIDAYFEDVPNAGSEREKELKKITCPFCGGTFEE